MPWDAAPEIITRCASPRALARISAPNMPPAPGLFSTTIGCPSRVPNHSASARDMMSAAPAGGKLTIHRIGFVGQAVVCAAATLGAAEAAVVRSCRRESMEFAEPPAQLDYKCRTSWCNMRAGH